MRPVQHPEPQRMMHHSALPVQIRAHRAARPAAGAARARMQGRPRVRNLMWRTFQMFLR